MKKLLTLLGAITLITTTSTSVISCGCTPGKKEEDKKKLDKIILNKDLDSIYIGQALKPTKTQILAAIKMKNAEATVLSEDDFELQEWSLTKEQAIIIGKNNYQDEVVLTFKSNNFKIINTKGITANAIIENIKKINNILYVSTTAGKVYKATDDTTFIEITGITGTINSLTVDKDGNVYVASNNSSDDDNVYKSNGTNPFTLMTGITGKIKSLTTDKNGNIYAGSSNGIIYKATNKNNFNLLKNVNSTISNLIITSNNIIYVVTPSGIYKSNDGTNFEVIINKSAIKSITFDNNNNVYYGNKSGFIYKSNDGTNFDQLKHITGEVNSLITDKNNNIYAGSSNGNVYKSNGTNSFTLMTGITGTIKDLTTDKNDNIYAAVAEKTSLKSALYLSEKNSN